MKNILVLSLVLLFASTGVFAQDTQQIYGLEGFKGDYSSWGEMKGKTVIAQKGFIYLKIDKIVLVIPEKQKNNSKKIISEFLSSGHSTGVVSGPIPVYKYDSKENNFIQAGSANFSTTYQDGDD